MRDPVERYCQYCGKLLVQRENESRSKYRIRVCCNFGCGAHLGHKRQIEEAMLRHGVDAEEMARRREAGLCFCGKPLRRSFGVTRKTCGDRACLGFNAAAFTTYADGEQRVPWPKVTGPVVADFSPYEVVAKDGGWGLKIVKADDRSYSGCSAAYTADRGGL